ncbi:MAG: hypothetical protein AB1772_01140 [Candidatus Zixiibacteriota bacterium]
MGIDFGAIIQKSFEMAWRFKTLWIFGLFAGGGDAFNFNWTEKVDSDELDMSFAYDWFDQMGLPTDLVPPEFAVLSALLLWVVALGLLFFICYLIAQPAIIDAVNKITRGGQYSFGTSFSRGTDFFWRFFGITMVEFFAAIALIAAIVVLAIVLTPFSLLLTIPAGLVVFFGIYHTFSLAEVAMVARDNAIADAIVEGWNLLMRNKANCFIMSLIMIGLGIGIAIVVVILAAIFYLPINLLVLGVTENLVAILFLALFIGLPVALVIGGYVGAFFNALYVQFYFRLVEPPQAAAVPGSVVNT